MTRATDNFIGNCKIETLEDRRHMSSVQLVDGMLILQGNAHGHNRLAVTPDDNGTTLFARANKEKAHYLIKDIKTIRIIGGEKADRILIDQAIAKSSYIRCGAGNDTVQGGGGSDTVFGGADADSLTGNAGDDLLNGQSGPDKINAGNGDDPDKINPRKNAKNGTAVSKFTLVNAADNKTIGTLTNGATLNLSKLPERMNVSAGLSGKTGSVRFIYDGQDFGRIENNAPFALAADKDGDFNGWTPRVGTHTLTATPYSGKNATGEAGTALTITFNVVANDDAPAINGTGVTPSEITDNDNPDSTDNTNAPNAVIDVMDATVPVGNAIHVNALKSALNVGDDLGARYEWNFGDAGSKYNTLTGFNVAHAYTKPGSYVITLKLTNSAGKSDTVSTKVTITAANRRFIYVSPDGNDANNGSSQGNAVKTFARAAKLVGDNTEVLFERGHTYSVKDGMYLGHTNVTVGAYGPGAKPVLKYTDGMDHGAIFATTGGKNVVIEDLAFDSSSKTTSATGFSDGVRIGGQNITVRDCTFLNVNYAINTNGFPDGVLIQDNVAPNNGSTRAYFAWVQGADQVYLGNVAEDSIHGHNLRVGGADRVNIQYNDFTNLAKTAGLRGTLTLHVGHHLWVANNKLTEGTLGLGPLDQQGGLKEKGERLKWVVVEKNQILDTYLKLGHGTEHVSVRDNLIRRNDDIAIDMPGYSDDYKRGISDVYIVHNTVLNNGKTGKFLKVGGAVAGVTVSNNLYVAPNLVTGEYHAAPILITNKDLAGFRLISNNIWPAATIMPGAGGGINFVGDPKHNAGYQTPAEWEAYKVVVNDQYKDVKLGDTYTITVGGVEAGADLKKAA